MLLHQVYILLIIELLTLSQQKNFRPLIIYYQIDASRIKMD